MTEPDSWRVCSICRALIGFDQTYYRCSVSTCNRKRTAMYFCSLECWEAHVPMLRHRDAWAEKQRSPTREAYAREVREQAELEAKRSAPAGQVTPSPTTGRRIVSDTELPRDVLVVVSKLKAYIRARSGMNTSDNVVAILSDHLRHLCGCAIRKAAEDDRKTVMDRDFAKVLAERDRG